MCSSLYLLLSVLVITFHLLSFAFKSLLFQLSLSIVFLQPFFSPSVLVLPLLFVVPVNGQMGPGYGCCRPLQDYH